MQPVTIVAWQQNMCTGACLPMWEGEVPALKDILKMLLCLSLAGRKNSIANEWKFSTKAELLAGDVKLSAILQESPTLNSSPEKMLLKSVLQDTSSYRAPSVAPDGKYRAPTTCASGVASGGTVA